MSGSPGYDVVIIGGGLAGLTLAAQLKKVRPATSVLVLERNRFPAPEAAFKVGESVAETGALYLADFVGIQEHLDRDQLPKHGLRFFLPPGDVEIEARVEVGAVDWPAAPTYQVDRGRLENFLVDEVRRRGGEVREGSRVIDVEIERGHHRVRIAGSGETGEASARWLVDASGRPGLLKRRLELDKKPAHNVSAAWFRVDARIDVERWCDTEEWRSRVPEGRRWLSTNHLLGSGYWVWLIPLASGATSVGVVADESIHPFESLNTLPRFMAWLREHEPQCALQIEPHLPGLLDFQVLRNFVLGAKRVFSPDRWALTGDAGTFLDPLYSVGTNFVGSSNCYITDFVTRDLDGEDVDQAIEWANGAYIFQFEAVLKRFVGLYPVMGHAEAFYAQLVWNLASFWSVPGLVFCQRRSTDQQFQMSIAPIFMRYGRLNARTAAVWREWARREPSPPLAAGFLEPLRLGLLRGFNRDLTLAPLPAEELREKLLANLARLEELAVELFRRAEPGSNFSDIDPYAFEMPPIGARPTGPRAAPQPGSLAAELDEIWPARANTRPLPITRSAG